MVWLLSLIIVKKIDARHRCNKIVYSRRRVIKLLFIFIYFDILLVFKTSVIILVRYNDMTHRHRNWVPDIGEYYNNNTYLSCRRIQ